MVKWLSDELMCTSMRTHADVLTITSMRTQTHVCQDIAQSRTQLHSIMHTNTHTSATQTPWNSGPFTTTAQPLVKTTRCVFVCIVCVSVLFVRIAQNCVSFAMMRVPWLSLLLTLHRHTDTCWDTLTHTDTQSHTAYSSTGMTPGGSGFAEMEMDVAGACV